MKAIDARSIDRQRFEHCRALVLTFRDPMKEAKVGLTLVMNFYLSCIFSMPWKRIECSTCTSFALLYVTFLYL